MLRLHRNVWLEMVGHCYDGLPDEACGLLAGPLPAPGSDLAEAARCYPAGNDARSAKVYTVNPKDHLRADRDADDHGMAILGVFHSHTHTDPYPSPTDVAQAPDPAWHYVIVSLRDDAPMVRSYRIRDGKIAEEAVVLVGR